MYADEHKQGFHYKASWKAFAMLLAGGQGGRMRAGRTAPSAALLCRKASVWGCGALGVHAQRASSQCRGHVLGVRACLDVQLLAGPSPS